MDYKEIVETLKFNVVYFSLSAGELRVLTYMLTSANYKTSKISIGYSELAKVLDLSKSNVQKIIKSLIEKKMIALDEKSIGQSTANYLIRSVEDLTMLHEAETKNDKHFAHLDLEKQKFGALLDGLISVGSDCKECKNIDRETGEGFCGYHWNQQRQIKGSIEYREYLIWKKENPTPKYKIKTINGKEVDE